MTVAEPGPRNRGRAPSRYSRSAVIASVICDSGDRYLDRYFDPDWLAANGFDISPIEARLDRFLGGAAG